MKKIVFWKLIYGCCYILELPLFGLERNSELVFPSDITTSVMTWWCLLRVWEKFRFTILNPWELSIWFGALRDIYHVAIITNELFCNLFIKKIQLIFAFAFLNLAILQIFSMSQTFIMFFWKIKAKMTESHHFLCFFKYTCVFYYIEGNRILRYGCRSFEAFWGFQIIPFGPPMKQWK